MYVFQSVLVADPFFKNSQAEFASTLQCLMSSVQVLIFFLKRRALTVPLSQISAKFCLKVQQD